MAGSDEGPRPPWGGGPPDRRDTRKGETRGPVEQAQDAPRDPFGTPAPRRPFARELGEDLPPDPDPPDDPGAPELAAEPTGTRHFPCSSCGGDLAFSPGQTQLVCPYCGHVQQIPAAPSAAVRRALRELDYRAAVENRLPPGEVEEKRVTRCPNCGAEVEFAENVHADRCPFCDSAVVADTGAHRLIKPQAVLPFVLTEEAARERMTRWLGSLWFAPGGLQQYARKGRRLSGIYVPYFTFDAATRTRYQGMRGTAYTEMQTVTVMVDGRAQRVQQPVRKIRWTPVSGQVARRFDDVLVLASTGLPRKYAAELDPWNLDALRVYDPQWLAGFRAESYTVDLTEAHDVARRKMDEVIIHDIRRDIGGDAQQIGAAETALSDETFKHILLPVWTAAYRYGGRSYSFIVNGQTGEVQGERPWSAWKIAVAVVVGILLALLILWATAEGQGYRLRLGGEPAAPVLAAAAPGIAPPGG